MAAAHHRYSGSSVTAGDLEPSISYTGAATTGLSKSDDELIALYLRRLKGYWASAAYCPSSIVVDLVIDPEEPLREIVVTHELDAGAQQALRYWDEIGEYLAHWMGEPDSREAVRVLDSVVTDVSWED